jgi:hypothetical protein
VRSFGVLLAVPGLAAWVASVGRIHPYHTGAVGLVAQLPVLWWAGLLLVIAAVGFELSLVRIRPATMVLSVLALACVLHGTLPASETAPRFDAAYSVAGFSQQIADTGKTLPRFDARFSWFGVFSAAGMAARAMHVGTLWFLRWAPLAFEVLYLVPVKALANVSLKSSRAQWAALPIFLAGNWIDQDYFSPQAIALFLYLVVLVIAVRTFADHGAQPRLIARMMETRRYRSLTIGATRLLRAPLDAVPAESFPEDSSRGARAALLGVVIVLCGVLALSHQISPVTLTIVLAVLVCVGRTQLRTVWLWVAFFVIAWLSWEARAYWSGHLTKIFGGVGQVGATVSVTVVHHARSNSIGRSLVEGGRAAEAVVTLLGAAIGAFILWRRGRTIWTVVVLALTPVVTGGVVSYGGEVALRILLFSLAPLAVLVAAMLDGPPTRRSAVVLFAATGLVLVALFPLNRFGNESFEAFAPGDVAAATWIHEHAPDNSDIFVFNKDEPLLFSHVGDYKITELDDLLYASPATIAKVGFPPKGGYVYLTRSQYEFGVVYDQLPTDWLAKFEHSLAQVPFIHPVYVNSTAEVLQVDSRQHLHVAPVRHRIHVAPPSPKIPQPKPPVVVKHHVHPPVVHRYRPPVVHRYRPPPVHRTKPPKTTTTTLPTTSTTKPTTSTTKPTTSTTKPTTSTTQPTTPTTTPSTTTPSTPTITIPTITIPTVTIPTVTIPTLIQSGPTSPAGAERRARKEDRT